MPSIRRRPVVAGLLGAASGALGGCLNVLGSGDSGRTALPDIDPFYVVTDGESDGGNLYAARRISRVTAEPAESTLVADSWYEPPADRRVVDVELLADGAIVADAAADDAVELATMGSGSGPTDTSIQLRRLDDEGTVQTSRRVEGLASIAVTEDAVVAVSSHGAFTFDRSLEPQGAAELSGGLQDKHMEDVLVQDGVAYVVDDVVYPRYLFRVDVADPAAPRFLEAVQTVGVGQTLGQQWLVPEANRWYVLQSASSRGGSSQSVLATPMRQSGPAGPEPRREPSFDLPVRSRDAIHSQTVYRRRRSREDDITTTRGTVIHDVTSRAPVWAAIEQDDGVTLARLRSGEEVVGLVSFDHRQSLPAPARVTRVSDHVLTVGAHSEAPTVSILDPAAGDLAERSIETGRVLALAPARQR